MNAAAQIYLLTRKIKKKLKKNNNSLKNTKIFTALTYEDHTIDAKKSLDILLNNTNPDKRHLILYHQNNLPENLINKKNLYPIKSSMEEKKILNLSHVAISNNTQNIWYGKNGKYRNCLHYQKEKNKNQNYDLCKSSNTINYGEVNKNNLEKGIMVRLTFNPFIDKLFSDLGNFLGI